MFSSTIQEAAVLGLGGEERDVVLAEDAGAHEPEEVAELLAGDPAVREGHGRSGQAAALGDDLVEELVLHPRDELAERPDVGPDPAGSVDDRGSFDDARERVPRASPSRGTTRAIASR